MQKVQVPQYSVAKQPSQVPHLTFFGFLGFSLFGIVSFFLPITFVPITTPPSKSSSLASEEVSSDFLEGGLPLFFPLLAELWTMDLLGPGLDTAEGNEDGESGGASWEAVFCALMIGGGGAQGRGEQSGSAGIVGVGVFLGILNTSLSWNMEYCQPTLL